MSPLDPGDPSNIDCAARLKVLADPTRLAVVEALLDGPRRVGALNERLGLDPSLLSHHLRVLRESRLVETARDGKAVEYRLADGVAVDGPGRAVDLGCCRLRFDSGTGDDDA